MDFGAPCEPTPPPHLFQLRLVLVPPLLPQPVAHGHLIGPVVVVEQPVAVGVGNMEAAPPRAVTQQKKHWAGATNS